MSTLFSHNIPDIYPIDRNGGGRRAKAADKNIPSDAMGIEIEMETTAPVDMSTVAFKNFSAKNDGSLRNWGVEFVSAPISFKDRKAVLDEFDNILSTKLFDKRIEDCARTSVHIHANMRDKTYLQLMNVLTAYVICEGPMVAWCGPTRMGNLFALRIPEASTNFDTLVERTKVYDAAYFNGEQRYSALNLCALSTFGTIEFRSLRGVYDTKVYDKWMMALAKLIEVSTTEFRNPLEIVDYYQNTPNNAFLHRFLGDLIYDIETLARPCYNLMEEGYEYALTLATCHVDNWELDPKNDWRNDPTMVEWFNSQGYVNTYNKLSFRYKDYNRIKMNSIGNPPVMREARREEGDFNPEPEHWEDEPQFDEGMEIIDDFGPEVPIPAPMPPQFRVQIDPNDVNQIRDNRLVFQNLFHEPAVGLDWNAFRMNHPQRNNGRG